ncbi:MAG: prepilin-type N-terminal cleavage/methylation domain-containing protein [Planctomycetales bacterium]
MWIADGSEAVSPETGGNCGTWRGSQTNDARLCAPPHPNPLPRKAGGEGTGHGDRGCRARGRSSLIARHSALRTPHSALRPGFTLVEMLVSVALVLLLMLMLATVFSLATTSIAEQRGIGQNDQRTRMLTTILRDDFENRVFRYMVPFEAGELDPGGTDPLAFNNREGYFYISENDPDDATDDVLRFTVRTDNADPYYGRAAPLGLGTLTGAAATTYLNQNRNQPDWDDGMAGNGSMTSPQAEIAYFLRKGILYRRVMLVRQQLSGNNQPESSSTPVHDYFDPANNGTAGNNGTANSPPPYTGVFWRDFDASAFLFDPLAFSNWAHLHGASSLNNGAGVGFFSLGLPYYRFGHNHQDGTARAGMPREWATDSNSGQTHFIGGFTQEETSSNAFRYPQSLANGNPMTESLILSNGVVTKYQGGPRRAEDVLMTQVHAFDVKVWDDGAAQFVDLGGSGAVDYLTQTNTPMGNRNTSYGPGGPSGNRVFDTWHPAVDFNQNLAQDDPADYPPFRPVDAQGNPKPLKAIQITVRFRDVTSDQLRQMTLVQSFVN